MNLIDMITKRIKSCTNIDNESESLSDKPDNPSLEESYYKFSNRFDDYRREIRTGKSHKGNIYEKYYPFISKIVNYCLNNYDYCNSVEFSYNYTIVKAATGILPIKYRNRVWTMRGLGIFGDVNFNDIASGNITKSTEGIINYHKYDIAYKNIYIGFEESGTYSIYKDVDSVNDKIKGDQN